MNPNKHWKDIERVKRRGTQGRREGGREGGRDRETHLPVPLHHVNDLVHRRVTPQVHIGIVNLVLPTNRNHRLGIQRRLRHKRLVINPSFILLPEHDAGRLLVQTNAKPIQLAFDQNFVGGGLGDVEDDENNIAGTGGGNDLTTTACVVVEKGREGGREEGTDGEEGKKARNWSERGKGERRVEGGEKKGTRHIKEGEEGREEGDMTYLCRPSLLR